MIYEPLKTKRFHICLRPDSDAGGLVIYNAKVHDILSCGDSGPTFFVIEKGGFISFICASDIVLMSEVGSNLTELGKGK